MAVCGCGDRCTCTVTPGDNIVITGSGDSTDPLVVSGVETVFAAANSDNAISITPGGSYGHAPVINVNVSSDGGNVLTKHANGLYVGATALAVAARYIGELIDVTGLTTPGLTLEADAAEYAIASYPALAVEYGATGVGDGIWDNHPQLGIPAAGNFRVPDLRDRASIGRGTFAGAVGQTDAITEASRTNTHDHSVPSLSVTGTAAGTTDTHAFTIETGVGAGGTQAEWDKVGATTDNSTNQANATRDSIEDIVNFNTGTTVAITSTSVVSSTASTHDHGVSVPVTGSTGTGTTGAASVPYATVRKVVFAGV